MSELASGFVESYVDTTTEDSLATIALESTVVLDTSLTSQREEIDFNSFL